ncbi:hypothetical protein NE237_031272 [Protea cynaroides]|uniref:Uncharacterized protein n=1 Tax=Protea cynaroides TaxID=273540 RepID=A0A9Q0L1A3_9MAGN|nr:hypothetical protein NE237_031272 [Protea cynaroides]
MSSTSRAWIVAASVGAVEALRSLNQHAKNNLGSLSQTTRLPSPSFAVAMTTRKVVSSDEKIQQSEESLRKVIGEQQQQRWLQWQRTTTMVAMKNGGSDLDGYSGNGWGDGGGQRRMVATTNNCSDNF